MTGESGYKLWPFRVDYAMQCTLLSARRWNNVMLRKCVLADQVASQGLVISRGISQWVSEKLTWCIATYQFVRVFYNVTIVRKRSNIRTWSSMFHVSWRCQAITGNNADELKIGENFGRMCKISICSKYRPYCPGLSVLNTGSFGAINLFTDLQIRYHLMYKYVTFTHVYFTLPSGLIMLYWQLWKSKFIRSQLLQQ